MNIILRHWIAALTLSVAWLASSANELIIDGTAIIRDGNVAEAREQAIRSALARAAESRNARISAQSTVGPNATLETTQLSTTACIENNETLAERHQDNELIVTLRVRIAEDGKCSNTPNTTSACQGSLVNRIAVTGFALEFPEQKSSDELPMLSRLTASELAGKIIRRGNLLADFEENLLPYRSPAHAPEALMGRRDSETPFANIARRLRAQYVLSGIYRDFGITRNIFGIATSRRIEIEAFLHDGAGGQLLARQRFAAIAYGDVRLAAKPEFGTPTFYHSDLGSTLGIIFDQVASWAENQAACQPFIARVLKTEKQRVWIDAGAESRLSAGDSLTLHSWREPAVTSENGISLGKEKQAQASATVIHVYPKFSVLELKDAPKRIEIRQGDVLYAQ